MLAIRYSMPETILLTLADINLKFYHNSYFIDIFPTAYIFACWCNGSYLFEILVTYLDRDPIRYIYHLHVYRSESTRLTMFFYTRIMIHNAQLNQNIKRANCMLIGERGSKLNNVCLYSRVEISGRIWSSYLSWYISPSIYLDKVSVNFCSNEARL